MGNTMTGPALSTSTGAIGLLELNLCCTGCGGGRFENCCGYNPCCPALGEPNGPEWAEAAPGFAPYLAEAEQLAASLPGCLCGSGCYDAQGVKAILDARWLGNANAYLLRYNLRAEVFFWVTYNDKGEPQPHVAIQFFRYQAGQVVVLQQVGYPADPGNVAYASPSSPAYVGFPTGSPKTAEREHTGDPLRVV